jgi:hypothetical protein
VLAAAPVVAAPPPVVPHQPLPPSQPFLAAPAEAYAPSEPFLAAPAEPYAPSSPVPPQPAPPAAEGEPWAVSPVPLRPVSPAAAPTMGTAPLVQVAAGLGLVGVVGGYAVGRWGGLSAVGFLGLLWWLGSATALSLLARKAAATTVAITLFLFTFVATPVVVGATMRGLAERAVAALEGAFDDFSTDFSEELEGFEEGFGDLPAG